MRNIIVLYFFFLLLFANAASFGQKTIRIATYNIRYDTKVDSLDAWPYRSAVVADVIKFHNFEIFGVQEALHHQLTDLIDLLKDYAYVGGGRDDGRQRGEYSAILYKKNRFKLLEDGTFWLSPTDITKPGKGWDAALPRVCTWALFEDKVTGKKFYHFNTHFDHRGLEARRESARLMISMISKIAGKSPFVFTGDLNFDQHSENYQLICNAGIVKDAFDEAPVKLAYNGTFNGFDINRRTDRRIDHVFVSPSVKTIRYGVLTDSYQGRMPSDHYPILVELSF